MSIELQGVALSLPVTITINRSEAGRFLADLPGAPQGALEADSLDDLIDDLGGWLAAALMTQAERDAEDADDNAAADAALAEAEREGTVPLAQVKAELGL